MKIEKLSVLITICLPVLLLACQSLPLPDLPPRDPQDIERSYEQYSLQREARVIQQGEDVELRSYRQLNPLFAESSEKAKSLYRKSRLRSTLGTISSGVGGALIGFPMGYRLGSDMSLSETDYIVMGAGVGMGALGIVMNVLSNRPLSEAIDEYNLELKNRWGYNCIAAGEDSASTQNEAQPDFSRWPTSFEGLRSAMLDLNRSTIIESDLSPYQEALLYYWWGEYNDLLNIDLLTEKLANWTRPDAAVSTDLCRLFAKSRYAYFDDLVAEVQNSELEEPEKEFLELFLLRVLSEGEDSFISNYQLSERAKWYIRSYPDAQFNGFVETNLQGELPQFHWTLGGSVLTAGSLLTGNLNDLFSSNLTVGLALQVSYKNYVLIPAAGTTILGSIKSSFFYDGEQWGQDPDRANYGADFLDLFFGYRLDFRSTLALTPRIGMGLFDMWESGEGNRLGFSPTASAGLVLENFKQGSFSPDKRKHRIAVGLDYKLLLKPWDSQFAGSQIVLSVMWPGWVWVF